MILYNVTVSIDESIKDDWLTWMKTKHVPDVMATGCFIESRISRVNGEEQGGVTFAVSYLSPSEDALQQYQDVHSAKLQQEHSARYQGKFAAFRTILTVIEEFKL